MRDARVAGDPREDRQQDDDAEGDALDAGQAAQLGFPRSQ
jgi:hypothetical protein